MDSDLQVTLIIDRRQIEFGSQRLRSLRVSKTHEFMRKLNEQKAAARWLSVKLR